MHTNQSIKHSTGVPMTVPYSMSDMEVDLHGVTHNVGNTIHVEAPARMLSYDTFGSASTFLSELYYSHNGDVAAVAKEISEKFDYLLVSEANVFRLHGRNKEESEKNSKRLKINADILDNLTIPFSVIGAGIQSIPSDDLNEFDSNIAYFLRVVNKKAEMLGVRGRATRDWLARAGISHNVKVLVCQSLFLYPKNVQGICYKPLDRDSRVITAGYLTYRHLKHHRERVDLTLEIANNFHTDFLLQDDYYELSRGEKDAHYNEALGLVDRSFVLEKLSEQGFDASSIGNFLHFRNSYTWRFCCGQYDAYIGDRLHGGIAAMQAQRPAMIFHDDFRVKELVDLFQIPSASINDLKDRGVMEMIDKNYTPHAFEKFKDSYADLYKNFKSAMKNAGLSLRDIK